MQLFGLGERCALIAQRTPVGQRCQFPPRLPIAHFSRIIALMRATTLILLLLASLSAVCQTDNDPRIATGSNYLTRPNELGFNMAPLGIWLLRGTPKHARFSITYKRLVENDAGKKGALRFGGIYIDDANPDIATPFETSLLESRVGTVETRLERHNEDLNLAGFAGFELRMKRGNVYILSGVDLFTRVVALESTILRKQYEIDPTGDIEPKTLSTEQLEQITASNMEVGVSPFIGAMFRATRRLSFTVETGLGLSYTFGNRIVDTNKELDTEPVGFTDFNIRYIIRDLSLYYRF